MKRLIALVFAGSILSMSGVADAASGRIRGYFKMLDNSGGYCDDATLNCSGAQYKKADFGASRAIKDAKIYIKDQNSSTIGTCSTSTSGYYSCAWSRSTMPTSVRAYFHYEDKDLRHKVVQPNGNRYYWRSSAQSVSNGQNKYIGTITIPKQGLASIYSAAQRMYYDSLDRSGRMRTDYTGIVIKAYDTSCSSTSNNVACANGSLVRMPNSGKAYQSFVVVHELGHVADWISNPRKLAPGSYCYPGTGSGCSHDLDSREWRGHALVEGMATFLGASAWYKSWAPAPMSCFFTSGRCKTESEQRIEPEPTCSSKVGRQENMTTSYLWDVYDSYKSSESSENVDANFHDIIDAIHAIPDGYNWGQKESFYGSDGSTISQWDSYHQWEWNQGFESTQSFNSSPAYFHNCLNHI